MPTGIPKDPKAAAENHRLAIERRKAKLKGEKRKYKKRNTLTGAAAHGLRPGVYVAKVEKIGESYQFTFMKIQS